MLGYLSQAWVQEALGVPVNFTESSNSVFTAFNRIGDFVRGNTMEDIAFILDSGVKVALVYGDRDFACNWIGGENVSMNIPWSKKNDFNKAGYTDLKVGKRHIGGQVRQYGNLSFTRVYQAGHEVPAYQPETAYEIFRRSMNNLDIATGKKSTAGGVEYKTEGRADTFGIKMKAPKPHPHECYILSPGTCTEAELKLRESGDAQVKNYILKSKKDGGAIKGSGERLAVVRSLVLCLPAVLIALLSVF
jgi:hypothetical protein